MKKTKKYSNGGQLISSLSSLIPGIGSLISPLILAADQMMDKNKIEEIPQAPKMNLKPLGYAKGGFIGDKFKQYNTGSHLSGNDLTVNNEGIPDLEGKNAVQNKENTFKIKGKTFVMSDTLINPDTNNTFNIDAAKINKKYKNARFNLDEKNALEREMMDLANLNNSMNKLSQVSKQFARGGYIDPDPPPTGTIYDNKYTIGTEERYDTFNEDLPYQDHLFNEPIPTVMSGDPQSPTIDTNYGTEVSLGSNLSNSNVASTERSIKPPSIGTNNLANTLGLALKAVNLGRSAYDAFSSPVKEDLLLPNYSQSDRYMREANIDYSQAKQDSLGVSNLNSNLNRSASTNFGQFAGRQSGNFAALADQVSNIDMSQNNAQSQLNLTKANYEQGKAIDTTNRQYQNQQNNFMNDANQRNFNRDFFNDLGEIGGSLNQYSNDRSVIKNRQEINNFNNNQMIAFLNAKYPNLQINPNIITQFKTGNLNIDDFLSYLPSSVQQDVKQNKK